MLRLTSAVLAMAGALGVAGAALAQSPGGERGTAAGTLEIAAQKKKAASRRAPARIRVRPQYPYYRHASPYPRPDEVSHPGPNAVRECTAWLAVEHRPAGTVIVPHRRCWWERR